MSKKNSDVGTIDKSDTNQALKPPVMYAVIFHNDDFTSMEFVTIILMREFHLSEAKARIITLNVHEKGSGVAGIFTYEIAEMKASKTMIIAQHNQYPLKVTIEPE